LKGLTIKASSKHSETEPSEKSRSFGI